MTDVRQLDHTILVAEPAPPVPSPSSFIVVPAPAPKAATAIVVYDVAPTAITAFAGLGATTSIAALDPATNLPGSATFPRLTQPTNITVTFDGEVPWVGQLQLGSFAAGQGLNVWCMRNGFFVTNAAGQLTQISWFTP